jgi:glycine cleavage system pyridoxal-binding protein P
MKGSGRDDHRLFKGIAQQGLLKLMLKLPTLRGRLQTLAVSSTSLENYCEAYGEARAMLERMESGRETHDEGVVTEYRTICCEIENDVIEYCQKAK